MDTRTHARTHTHTHTNTHTVHAHVQGDAPLMELIHKKYSIKNTTGYSINALADHSPRDPIEILKRLMIGSGGDAWASSRR